MIGIQVVEFEITEEHITACFNDLSVEITASLACDATPDWEGADGFYNDFITLDNEEINYPIIVNGVFISEAQAKLMLGQHFKKFESLILKEIDVDNWKIEEGYDYD